MWVLRKWKECNWRMHCSWKVSFPDSLLEIIRSVGWFGLINLVNFFSNFKFWYFVGIYILRRHQPSHQLVMLMKFLRDWTKQVGWLWSKTQSNAACPLIISSSIHFLFQLFWIRIILKDHFKSSFDGHNFNFLCMTYSKTKDIKTCASMKNWGHPLTRE